MNIHVSNLSPNIIDADLRKLFSPFGEVTSAEVLRDKLNGRSKGSALVHMAIDAQGSQAILCLDRTVVDGKPISVSEVVYDVSDHGK
ncbi:MAG TPA: RNA-binding protein [Chitinophagaceae bacterium]